MVGGRWEDLVQHGAKGGGRLGEGGAATVYLALASGPAGVNI